MSASYKIWAQQQLKKVKTFFYTKDVLTFLIFLLISTTFWFVHALDRPRETKLNIPVVVDGVPADVQVLNKLPETIEVKVRDKGKNLFRYGKNKLSPIHLDFEGQFKQEEGTVRLSKQVLQQKVLSELNATSELLKFSPDTLLLLYTHQHQKEVPVSMNALLQPMRQYQLRQVQIEPQRVIVYGTKARLQTLDTVYTERSVIHNLKDSMTLSVPLQQIQDVTFSNKEVIVRVVAERFTEKKMMVPVEPINFPKNYSVKVFPAEVEVSFNVPLSEFAFVSPQDVRVFLDYQDIQQDVAHQQVRFNHNLDYISKLKVNPMEVEFLLENKVEE